MQWAGHVACIREMKCGFKVLVGNLHEKDRRGDLDVDAIVIVILKLTKQGVRMWIGIKWLRIG
jgi:hypothetical protein